jgi:hypothetical protein
MQSLDRTIGDLAESAAKGVTRKDFIRALLLSGGAAILSVLRLGKTPRGEILLCGNCPEPCDSRPYCVQTMDHWAICNDAGCSYPYQRHHVC